MPLSVFPANSPEQSVQVAGNSDQVILQAHLGESSIACLTQSISSDQFADSAFDRIASIHFLFERFRFHFFAPRL